MILGLLAERGPMHGHQIRRTAELTNAEVWGGITGGALYAELRKLDGEGLVQAVREEQVGRRPARTVYEITEEGRLELVVQRDAALEVVFGSADPLSVVLLFAAGADASELGERLTGQGVLPPLAVAAFRRGELRLEAELRWHEEFERQLAASPPGRPAPVRAVGGPSGRGVRAPRNASAPREKGDDPAGGGRRRDRPDRPAVVP